MKLTAVVSHNSRKAPGNPWCMHELKAIYGYELKWMRLLMKNTTKDRQKEHRNGVHKYSELSSGLSHDQYPVMSQQLTLLVTQISQTDEDKKIQESYGNGLISNGTFLQKAVFPRKKSDISV